MLWKTFICITVLNSILSFQNVQCNEKSFSTSVSNMEQLLYTEQLLIDTLDNYQKELQRKNDFIKNIISDLREENYKALSNTDLYLYNPLNGFSLIRRMHQDWNKIEKYMKEQREGEYLQTIRDNLPNLPSASDLYEACEAIYRLQTTYDLKPNDMSEGILNGKKYSVKLKSIDRFTMGQHLLEKSDYLNAALWFHSALNSYINSDYEKILEFEEHNIWHLYGETLLGQKSPQDALIAYNRAYALRPNNVFLKNRIKDIEYIAKEKTITPSMFAKPAPTAYELACRGEFSNIPSKYHCLYNTTTAAFLRLAPFKMEILQLNPYVVIYHDVLYDEEIKELMEISKPNLKRSVVYNMGQKIKIERRTSQFSYFQEDFSQALLRIHQRLRDMTGLDLEGSDTLQVVNYVLGGHYDIHYDFFNASESDEIMRPYGDRIATVLFYLSDVEQGGATVFPNIHTAVVPRKGSALLWYNLNNKLQGDVGTLHAACPVIVGSKWVSNKWIRARPQIFRRPCYK